VVHRPGPKGTIFGIKREGGGTPNLRERGTKDRKRFWELRAIFEKTTMIEGDIGKTIEAQVLGMITQERGPRGRKERLEKSSQKERTKRKKRKTIVIKQKN